MTCEDVLATIEKGYWATTVAERNAACVHCRDCEACQQMLIDEINKIAPEVIIHNATLAAAALAKDRKDPEWR